MLLADVFSFCTALETSTRRFCGVLYFPFGLMLSEVVCCWSKDTNYGFSEAFLSLLFVAKISVMYSLQRV